MGNERASEKRELLKMDFPKNLLYAVRGGWEDEDPTELSQDVLSGIQYALSTLSDREQYILYERYREKRTLSSISEDLGVISERNLRYRRNMMFMTKGVSGYIKELNKLEYERGYQKGYDAGYKQGIEDAPIPSKHLTYPFVHLML